MKFLEKAIEWGETGKLPYVGLCYSLSEKESEYMCKYFEPSSEESENLRIKGSSRAYWASGLKFNHSQRDNKFTPLRQTIMAFCAVLNKEI